MATNRPAALCSVVGSRFAPPQKEFAPDAKADRLTKTDPYSEAKMVGAPDYEFRLGKERHLKGRGWRGLPALALLLTPLVVAAHHGHARSRAILHAIKW
jgi:hypothetical protein